MKFSIQEKLIDEAKSPHGMLYRLIVTYVSCVVVLIGLISVYFGKTSDMNFYFIINTSTVALLTWVIRKSFYIRSRTTTMALFRIGLFLQLNSSIVSTAGGLSLLKRDTASLIAAVLYIPSLLLLIYAFKRFIRFINTNYNSAVSMSLTDELTGLPNRRYLNLMLAEAETQTCIVCIADIDHFKKINDTHGHDVGDRILTELGSCFKDIISDEIFISRSGGEEFVIIIRDEICSRQNVQKIKAAASGKLHKSLSVTLSMGVAFKRPDDEMSSIMAAADDALYRAKRAGRDRIIYAYEESL